MQPGRGWRPNCFSHCSVTAWQTRDDIRGRAKEEWHERTLMAEGLGAKIKQVPHGYLRVQKRAEEYSHQTGARF